MKQVRHQKSLYIIYSILSISILSLFFINNTYADESSNLNYSVTVEPALNITTSSNKVSLDLNPLNHDFDSQDLTVSVSTNNETGYKLYVNTEKTTNNPNGNKLIEKDDNSLYIETLSGEVPDDADSFTSNRWGYKLNSSATNFSPFTPGTLVLSSKTIADGKNTDDITTMVFAAKVGYETKAGTYALALNFQATANPHYKTIADAEYMQDVSTKEVGGCPSDLTIGQAYELKDRRDTHAYYVARLKDGNCWMLQNLRLGDDTTTLVLTNEHSDTSSSGFTLNGKLSNGKFTYSTIGGVEHQNNSSQYYCTSDYGCYYNWYTATAGSGTTSVSTQGANVNYSICPAGWTLPAQSEISALITAYNGATDGGALAMLVSPTSLVENINGDAPGFVLGGRYIANGDEGSIGRFGRYWTRTAYNAMGGYDLYSSATYGFSSSSYGDKYAGMSIRCLLK